MAWSGLQVRHPELQNSEQVTLLLGYLASNNGHSTGLCTQGTANQVKASAEARALVRAGKT